MKEEVFDDQQDAITPQSIICIPFKSKGDETFAVSLVDSSKGEYLAAGNVLMNMKTKSFFEIEIRERDERMLSAFDHAGKLSGISKECLDNIPSHDSVIYVINTNISLQGAEEFARAALAILKAGGLGVKVESAGKAFDKATWERLLDNFEESNLFEMFVVYSLINPDDSVFSCGMHNLGLKDTIVYGEETEEAIDLINIFSYYQLIDKPEIFAGQTFASNATAPVFMIEDELDPPYNRGNVFTNPFGLWALERAEA